MSLTRFDHFMSQALYGPRGYYTSPRQILGTRGDFTTTPKLSQSLATAIAQWITLKWHEFGTALPIIELGPGDGTLARDIRQALGFFQRRKLNYHLVEISPHLRERQQSLLGSKASWHSQLTQALSATDSKALVISNEFIDAFPVRIFQARDHSFTELSLDSQLAEHWEMSSEFPPSSVFRTSWPSGQRLEVAESVRSWMHNELSLLRTGSVLTIDYGGNVQENYHRRPLGTLRAYFQHQRLDPPEAYQNPGHQDLTYDVNFEDLVQWGQEIDLTQNFLMSQAQFLSQFCPEHPPFDAEGSGQAFQVLEQIKISSHF